MRHIYFCFIPNMRQIFFWFYSCYESYLFLFSSRYVTYLSLFYSLYVTYFFYFLFPLCDIPYGISTVLVLFPPQFDEYPAVDKKKWREGATVKSRNEPHTIRQASLQHSWNSSDYFILTRIRMHCHKNNADPDPAKNSERLRRPPP